MSAWLADSLVPEVLFFCFFCFSVFVDTVVGGLMGCAFGDILSDTEVMYRLGY